MITGTHRILVTGAAGFVGSFVAARLAAMGHQVVGCDNFNDYYDPRLKHDRVAALLAPAGVACHTVELADAAQVAALFEREQPTLVVHLAAQAGVRYSIENPAAYVQSNLVAFGNILEACRHGAIEHLLYASSSSVYGANAKVPFSEDDQVDAPVSLYAATKKSNELMAHSYSHLFKLPATGLRFFTVYGPWGRPDMAYFSFAEKMARGATIPVFAEGLLTRDFTYIDDIVEGVVRLLFKPTPATETRAAHTVFNIGNHNPVRVLDFIQTLEGAIGIEARKEFLPMQPGDVPATHASIDKLKAWVDFAPTTPLAAGLASFWAWYRDWAPRRA
ncbi:MULTISPECIES: NAD-dependent epimerase/dehydratase family protein [Massilia]|uniref:Protein CapI n=1 Tax=Massilia aurea TaxID=373040 RepID=A0A422QNF4_9BURK|nr:MULTISPECIES: NAD-dependent epimerase/dehydratase family protein [Massilia]MDY0963396.1 NAD-dependent epimerase/dehydratase family protein [Massilia sp. CFBP9026]RNF31516.1 protein CapI [Massilia aurea]